MASPFIEGIDKRLGALMRGETEHIAIGSRAVTELLPLDANEQVQKVFGNKNNLVIVTFDTTGKGFNENKPKIEAGRVYGHVLYEQLITEDGVHWFDQFYQGKLKELTQKYLDIPVLYDAYEIFKDQEIDKVHDSAYAGNALVLPKHQFPVHEDSPGTVSAVTTFSVASNGPVAKPERDFYIPLYPYKPMQELSSGLIVSFNPDAVGIEGLVSNSGLLSRSEGTDEIIATFLDGTMPHGRVPITPGSAPCYSIASTYFLPGFKGRDASFEKTRSSK